jgi:leader peptidase (prepilin peptidase) / N-methyltransferase
VYQRRLPNRLLAAALVAVMATAAAGATTEATVHAVVGAALGGGLVLAVRLTRGIGMGDVKMAAVVGASVGCVSLIAVPVTVALAAAAAAGVGLVWRRTSLPFGPALWLGWAVVLSATSMGWWT